MGNGFQARDESFLSPEDDWGIIQVREGGGVRNIIVGLLGKKGMMVGGGG